MTDRAKFHQRRTHPRLKRKALDQSVVGETWVSLSFKCPHGEADVFKKQGFSGYGSRTYMCSRIIAIEWVPDNVHKCTSSQSHDRWWMSFIVSLVTVQQVGGDIVARFLTASSKKVCRESNCPNHKAVVTSLHCDKSLIHTTIEPPGIKSFQLTTNKS